MSNSGLSSAAGPALWQRFFRVLGHAPLPGMRGILSRLSVLEYAAPRQFTVQLDSMKYSGCLSQQIDRHIYFLGAYAPAELDFLAQAADILRDLRGPVTFVDVGANTGQHSLFMARRADRIFAFEPNGEVADQLEVNLRANAIRNVSVQRYALGREDGTGELGSGLDDNNGSRSLMWSLDASKNTVVEIRAADRALSECGLECADLVKVDVEGYEKNVFEGIAETLRRDRPVLLFELVGSDVKGGFRSEAELRSALYDDHCLFTLRGGRKARLTAFDWEGNDAVCLPRELVRHFDILILSGTRR